MDKVRGIDSISHRATTAARINLCVCGAILVNTYAMPCCCDPEQFRGAVGGAAGESAAEAAALKIARKAARKAEKARLEEQKALAAARAEADNRQMAAAEAEREAEEAAQLAELEAALAAERQDAAVASSRQASYEWTAKQSNGQRLARDAQKDKDRRLKEQLMQQVPDEEAWIFGREL